ncbi:MAG: dihydrofolate reductase [Luteitalea sp.]|nr:dihydrofolate reductase [Luteitalea sp.]
MRKLIITTFLSVDGVMQAPGAPDEDRSGGFAHGGWMVPHSDEDLGRIVTAWIEQASAFLLGRGTYEIFAAHWPRVTDPDDVIARALNNLPKYVASTTLKAAEWHNTTVISGDVVEAVRALKQEGTGELQVHGSPGLAQTLIANDLVDEYRLWVHPVVLGSGKRLFADGAVPAALRLSATKTTSTGVVVHTYERADALRYGAFSVDEQTSTKRLFQGEFRKA